MLCLFSGAMGFGPLPVYLALIFFIQSFIVYAIAVYYKDVDPVFPYLSSAADKRPESCVFAIGTNVSSVLLAILVFIRCRQIESICEKFDDIVGIAIYNCSSKWIGFISSFGMFIVANVQETANIPIHMTAAVVTFGGFCLYMILQCIITYKLTPLVTLQFVFTYRATCTALSVIAFFSAIGFGILASHIYHQTYPDLPTPRPWSRHFYQPGYFFHQVSAISEWVCAVSQIFFILSFGPEFEEISFDYVLTSNLYAPSRQGDVDPENEWMENV